MTMIWNLIYEIQLRLAPKAKGQEQAQVVK